ncbi:hypothetical protein ABIA33_001504 [Streptacidiphilus sp. MAP12-16]|uniref:hypothetical protein n=1 Tax=Streptacidiphilus sp. MAP12-16 TaxID=3156300 RepID=UPI0035187C32
MVLRIAAAQQHATIGSVLETAAFSLAIGLILLMAGRHQRTMADSALASGSPAQWGGQLVERPSTSRSRRISGLVIIVLSVPFLATGVLCLLDVLLLAIR